MRQRSDSPRQRVLDALAHVEPSRVPIDIGGSNLTTITDSTYARLKAHLGVEADDRQGRAHWEAHYRFGAAGRQVHNVIDGSFRFRDGRSKMTFCDFGDGHAGLCLFTLASRLEG